MYTTYLYTILLIFGLIISAEADPVRGLWVVRYALTDKDEVDNIIITAKSLNITDLYVQVRAMGQTFGYHKTGPGETHFGLLIKKARQENIRVHAWLNALYIWGGDTQPSDKSHLFYRSTYSILRAAPDKNIPPYRNLKKQGIEGFFIDPSDPSNLLDMKIIISELIRNYNVDGIHLDYMRYPSYEYSFSPNGRTRFFREYWFDPVTMFDPNQDTFFTDPAERYLYSSATYKDFLRYNLTDLLIQLKQFIKQFKAHVELSVAVKPNRKIANDYYFQDWESWLTNNICDHIVIMNYDTVMSNFINNLNTAIFSNDESKVIIGISTYNQDFQAVLNRMDKVRNIKNGGYIIFSYNYLREHPSYLNDLKKHLNDKN